MILRRVGNKKRLAQIITPHIPKHNMYIDLFFGAGDSYRLKVTHIAERQTLKSRNTEVLITNYDSRQNLLF